MPFLRVTRDRRGYENIFLLHSVQPGDRPRVLYWYRSAPGVRVGRPALDEDAIRAIEDRHPDIEFDWPHILEVGTMLPPEIERRPERPRRKPARPRDAETLPEAIDVTPIPTSPEALLDETPLDEPANANAEALPEPRHPMLEELAGREIAMRLHARYSELMLRIDQLPDAAARAGLHARADALNPDNWLTPEDILRGVQRADALFDVLRRELDTV